MASTTVFDQKHWTREYTRVLYKARAAIQRCVNVDHPLYTYYGARGVRVHPSWSEDPHAFARYLLTLNGATDRNLVMDRIDNNGHYEPGNIRFVEHWESASNRRAPGTNCKANGQFKADTEYGELVPCGEHRSPRWWRNVPARGEPPDVSGVLNRLDARRRLAVQLRVMEGKTLEETGRALGVTKERARQIVENTLRRLRCLTSLEL
jgi:hypothetical protein